MGDKKNYIDRQANELLSLGDEIDKLKSKATGGISESREDLTNAPDDIPTKIETARDKLIQIFFSIRDKNSVD